MLWLLTTLACTGSPEVTVRPAEPTPVRVAERSHEVPGPPVDSVDELRELEGVTAEQIAQRFGPPSEEHSFMMAECCHEFEIELYNTYPPGTPESATTQIRQLTYKYDGYAMTLWLHAPSGGGWVVLETSRYGDNVEF
ncbi:MAG: hypothetical protein ACI8S6_000253 [Myxococcota bacterium]|jgi:hypothetical protein